MRRGARPEPLVIGSILEADAASGLAALASATDPPSLVELRADHLRPEDVERFIGQTSRPVLVAARRLVDGGAFAGSETERVDLLERALAAGASIDVEWGSAAARLAERPDAGERVILSHHGGRCRITDLRATLRAMVAGRAVRLKLVPEARAVDEVLALRDLLGEATREGLALAAFATATAGVVSRILAPAWGSWATYGALARGRETAAGQLTVGDLLGPYGVLDIGPATRLYGLVGSRVTESPSPAMHAAGYREVGVDARYLPIETPDLDAGLALARGVGMEAIGATVPFKEALARRSQLEDDVAARASAVNTVRLGKVLGGWNTDGPAAVERIGQHVDLRHARVAILGSGATARACAAALVAAGARVVLLGRTPDRVAAAASATGASAASIDDLPGVEWDVLLHATPRGGDGERWLDPACLGGRLVVDVVYAPRPTALVADARSAGLATIDGVEFLAAQGVRQFQRMTGRAARHETLERAARRWLARRSA